MDNPLSRQRRVDKGPDPQWFRDSCGVLDYLHNQQPHPIIYRDMKPSNIMLQLKLPSGTGGICDSGRYASQFQ